MVILGKKIKSFENPIFVKEDVERVMIYKIQTHSKTTLNIFAKIKQIYTGYTLFAKEEDFKLLPSEIKNICIFDKFYRENIRRIQGILLS